MDTPNVTNSAWATEPCSRYGGSYSIENPAPYSPIAKDLIRELGIDVGSYSKYVDRALYSSSDRVPRIFFDQETFGVYKLVDDPAPLSGGETADLAVPGADAWKNFMANAPLSDEARKDVWRLNKEPKDYMPGLSSDQKKDQLARMSYTKFLTEIAGVHPEVNEIVDFTRVSWRTGLTPERSIAQTVGDFE